ncbi:TetR/AcrR family transcriptional regulator [Listeria sp. PSOL-1]|uniref:TetR/AcrR family transcriptional regulator n=1 Tax=Listeria sp. PSOL-1 TaxID=1844999 RepID=UPI0013D711EC|nr:TetR/AcrR family transcriptional regulator [Listeria sp. PSOL-1]
MTKYKKTIQTKKRLISSFAQLVEEKPIAKITVDNISKQAKVNRSTFYRHFIDKYELIEQVEAAIFTELDQIHVDGSAIFAKVDATNPALTPYIIASIAVLEKNTAFINAMLSINGDLGFETRMQNHLISLMKETTLSMEKIKNADPRMVDLAVHYEGLALFGVLKSWLQKPLESAEELAHIILGLQAHGKKFIFGFGYTQNKSTTNAHI